MPVTAWQRREALLQAATRYSSTETGLTCRGPMDMPAAGYVFGGDFIGFAEASKMSDEDLEFFIRTHTHASVQAMVPQLPSKNAEERFRQTVVDFVSAQYGRPITSIGALHKAAATEGQRAALIRGMAGGMDSTDLRKAFRRGPVSIALAVWNAAMNYADVTMVGRWVDGGGTRAEG